MEKVIVIVIILAITFFSGYYLHKPEIKTHNIYEVQVDTVVVRDTIAITGKTVFIYKTTVDTLTNTIIKQINVDACFDTVLIDSVATDSIHVRYRSLPNLFNLSRKLIVANKTIIEPIAIPKQRIKVFAEVEIGNSILGLGSGIRYKGFDFGVLATSDKKVLVGIRAEVK